VATDGPVVEPFQPGGALHIMFGGLHEDPPQPPGALLGDGAITGLTARGVNRGHEARVGAEFPGRWEPLDVSDLVEY